MFKQKRRPKGRLFCLLTLRKKERSCVTRHRRVAHSISKTGGFIFPPVLRMRPGGFEPPTY
jgi:hypothetical protein